MKKLYILLSLMFMLMLVIMPVAAKEEGGRYVFVPLLTKVNPAIPLRVQSQQAYQRLLPQLLASKKSGSILEFEPEFSAGIVKIKYAANAREFAITGAQEVLDNIHEAVAAVPHEQAPTVGRTASSPLFYPTLFSSCFDTYNLGANSYLVASLRTSANAVVANYAGYADGDGHLYDCFNWNGSYTNVIPGYKLTYKIFTALGGTVLGTYTATVPNITITGINAANSTASGTGPIGKPYWIDWSHANLNAGNTYLYGTQTGTVSNTGSWAVDFGTVKFRGGDFVDAYITQNANFIFDRWMYVPYAYCELGGNYCEIEGFPRQAATMTITHAGTPYTFTGKFSNWNWFSANLEDSMGAPIFITAGDKISGTGITTYTLPSLTAVPNFATDVVTGKAPANRYFTVWVYDVYNQYWYGIWTHSDAAGNYSANFSSIFNLRAIDTLTFEIYFRDPVTGNVVDRYFPFGP